MNEPQLDKLIEAACAVRQHAHAPTSGFLVGAALLTADGSIFVGCNVENKSLGLTQCAERSAVTAAVAAGQQELKQLVVASDGGASASSIEQSVFCLSHAESHRFGRNLPASRSSN